MSDNNLRPIWTPADYEETLAEAAKHRAIPGAYAEQVALYAEAERVGRHRKPHVITADVPPWADGRHDRDDDPFAVTSCTIAGRHRVRPDPWRRVRRLRAVLVVAVVVLVLALGALWASSHAKAETFDVCPSRLTGVASADTSCAFAENVRRSFYWNPGWTIVTTSPITGKFYTMQCSRTDTTGTGWSDSKRCFGVNDAGAVLVVYVA